MGTYPLIKLPRPAALLGNFQFSAGGATTKLVVAGGATYRLTLNNSAISESVSVAPTNVSLIIQDTLKTPLATAIVNHAPQVNLPGGVYQDQGDRVAVHRNIRSCSRTKRRQRRRRYRLGFADPERRQLHQTAGDDDLRRHGVQHDHRRWV